MAGIYFSPLDTTMPATFYPPFFDKGELVTPFYWGSHWPLARGNSTGWAIDDRVTLTPCHNSIVSWAKNRPEPLRTSRLETLDSLGHSKPMLRQTWAWLIGMTGADDARLLQWATSFSAPPSLELQGARFDSEPYSPERRAVRLVAEDKAITIHIKPASVCVNPVFELSGAPKSLDRVQWSGRTLAPREYAWDGRVLWLNATVKNVPRWRSSFPIPKRNHEVFTDEQATPSTAFFGAYGSRRRRRGGGRHRDDVRIGRRCTP